MLASVLLLFAGLYQQVNLILLVFTLTAGPFFASIFGGRSMLRRLRVLRRVPAYVFSGDPLVIDYTSKTAGAGHAALALFLGDSLGSCRSPGIGSGHADASGFFRPGGGARTVASPLAKRESQARQVQA